MHSRMIENRLQSIPPLLLEAGRRTQNRLDQLTKPLGGFGKFEPLLVRLSEMTGSMIPRIQPATLLFAADHGVTEENVSAYGAEVTEEMAVNIAMGTAMSSVLARASNSHLVIVDVGVKRVVRHPIVRVHKVAYGTQNFMKKPAMSIEQAIQSVEIGIQIADEVIDAGASLLTLGEMGIGNTTASSAVSAALLSLSAEQVTGIGTGIHDEQLKHKLRVIEQALTLHKLNADDPWGILAHVGGFEIGALVGAILAAASRRVPVVLDGFITTAAAMLAVKLNPAAASYLIASHVSSEKGHRLLLDQLGLVPTLDFGMRVGEGTGALMLLPLLHNAVKVLAEMATFEDARVSNPHAHRTADNQQIQQTKLENPPIAPDFTEAERQAVYKAILARRDIRVYLPEPIPEPVLTRILTAAHHAPSVGYMQPWNFVLIQDKALLQQLYQAVDREREAASVHYADEKRDYYLRLKLEGLLQAPLTICVTCDPTRGGPHVLGRNTIPETDLMSTSCAIENLWLAARAEGIAVGWISIYQKHDIRELLGLPDTIEPVALLTVGYTPYFPEIPVLERVGWGNRLQLSDLIFYDRWDQTHPQAGFQPLPKISG